MDYSVVDSHRFGVAVYRDTLPEIREREIMAQLLSNDVDVAILRFPTSESAHISRLDRLGVPYIVADTLVYYSVDLDTSAPPRPLRNTGLVFELAGPEHHQVVDDLVMEIFAEYRNHYTSNPFLPQVDALAGYCEWARAYCDSGNYGRWAWVVLDEGVPVGFLTCSETDDGRDAEGILYGVTPNASGRGIYGDLISFSQEFFGQRGASRMLVSTQVQNLAVQKAWVRAGFVPSHSFVTVHLNAFLSHSSHPPVTMPYSVTPDYTEEFGRLTGDMNPIHFDDDAALSQGFDGRIAHGIAVDAVASRYFGTIWPGPGCLYLGYSYRFLRPIYLSRTYSIVITFPIVDELRGFAKALLRVLDDEGGLCVLSYHDLRFGNSGA